MVHTVSAEGFNLTPKLQRYTTEKVRKIEKFVPRRVRESAVLAVHYKMANRGKEKTCTLALELPHETLAVRETAPHMFAALDLTAVEMRRQVADYKGKHSRSSLRRRLHRRRQRDQQAE